VTIARTIVVNGVVQGVGFRPFVYRIAKRNTLRGTVCNTSDGVRITLEGPASRVDAFLEAFTSELPPLASITSMRVADSAPRGIRDFRILPSADGSAHEALVPPDVSVCHDCLHELADPADHRYAYPFINCTDCGPRYTIVDDVPYDRGQTTMADFPPCDVCRTEYADPANRRFHAQAICCPKCGPSVTLFDNARHAIAADDPIGVAREALATGQILAVKGIGGFHLATDASNGSAVETLRTRKGRGHKPFAVMADGPQKVRLFCELSDEEEELLVSPTRPILLLRRRADCPLAPEVAPGNRWLGVMLPYTPLHRLLLDDGFTALVMTSGNLADEPIVIDDEAAFAKLAHVADLFLTHNRRILHRADDSIVKVTRERPRVWRRSRGFVPRPIATTVDAPPILAVGGMMKNTVAFTRGRDIFISQHLGDTDSRDGMVFFEDTIDHLRRFLGVAPETVAHDLHPDYLATRYALDSDIPAKIGVQHHQAHIAACQCEHGITDRDVIGFALDGTGHGTDGAVWGGEVFTGRPGAYTRTAHLEYVPLPGGEQAIRQPWRMAVAHLRNAGVDTRDDRLGLVRHGGAAFDAVEMMLARGINCPPTSSCGRLFDAVAATLGLARVATFEGEPAVCLEMAATENVLPPYGYDVVDEPDGTMILSPQQVTREIVNDLIEGTPVGDIAYRFHTTLIALFAEVAERVRARTGVDTVALGGGVFLNTIIATRLPAMLETRGFQVYMPEQVPPGDGGISLGQIAIARCEI